MILKTKDIFVFFKLPAKLVSIVSREQFDISQALLMRKAKPTKSNIDTIPSIYSGFLTCVDCGKKMVRNTAYYTDKVAGKTTYNRYVCSTCKKLGSKACNSHLIREDVLNDIMIDILDIMIKSIVKVSKAMKKAENTKLNKQIALLENDKYKVSEEIKKTSKLLEGLYADYREKFHSSIFPAHRITTVLKAVFANLDSW